MTPVRTTVVAPVAAPYREPLFAALQARADIDLTVIYGDAGQPSWDVPADYFATAHTYPAVHLSSRQIPRPGRTPVMLPRGVERALAASAPEVIIASEYGPLAIRTRIWAGRHSIPHLLLTECTPAIDALLPAPQLAWHRHFAAHVDGAIPVSTAARARLLAFGVAPESITVALQSADLAPIRAAVRALPPRPAGPPRILTVSRLVPDKNVAVLLRALAELQTDLPGQLRPHLDVIGDGFLRSQLQDTAVELDLDVTFHGHRSGAELAALYAQADVSTLLSGYEPFGVVVREAAAAGLAMVISDAVGAVGDVAIAGENAIVVAPGDVSATAVALSAIITDPTRRAQMAAASRRIDAETDGVEVSAVAEAVLRAAGTSRASTT